MYFGCGHIYQKAPFPVRSTVVKLVRDGLSTLVGDHRGNSVAAIFFLQIIFLYEARAGRRASAGRRNQCRA